MNNRIKYLQFLVMSLFIPILISLYYLQIYRGDYYRKRSLENILRVVPYSASRGIIMDCKGRKLVSNFPSFQIDLIPQELSDLEYVLRVLSKQFDISTEELKLRYKQRYNYPFAPITIIEDIPKLDAINFEASNNLKGVIVKVKPKRKYLYGQVASHVLGFLGKIDSSQLRRLRKYGYSATDYIGKNGIEGYFDSYLRGEQGGCLLEVDSSGRRVKILGIKNPVQGEEIRLTIDIELQKFVDKIFPPKKGAVIVMEPNTGYIRALVSKPNFNPNVFLSYEDNYNIVRELLFSKQSPLLNRAISGTYTPGSIFKIVVAAAGLESGIINLNDRFVCQGSIMVGPRKFECWYKKGHGRINLIQALKYSCNVFFYKLGLKLGVDRIYEYAKKFGLGKKTGIKLFGEAKGIVPSKKYKRKNFNSKWYKGDTANLSIGQGYIQITPIQALMMLSIIANKGFVAKPKLVESIGNIDMSNPELKYVDISPDTLEKIQQGLIEVVESPHGTGRLANVDGITVAGKTGTAQLKYKKSHAWFLGYAPADDPTISLAVIIEHGEKGGIQAARLAKKIFEYYLKP